MANTIEEQLLDSFLAIAGEQTPDMGPATPTLDELTDALRQAAAPDPEAAMPTLEDVAQAVHQTAASAEVASPTHDDLAASFREPGTRDADAAAPAFDDLANALRQTTERSGGALYDVLSVSGASQYLAAAAPAAKNVGGGASMWSTIAKSAFGLAPLISGLIGLFGGGDDSSEPEPLIKYALPARLDIVRAATAEGFGNADYDQTGMPRAYGMSPQSPATMRAAPLYDSETSAAAVGYPSRGGAQITVNVQAMDARSFLDRSAEIAAAVRNAMLNLNSINDVVNDL